MGYTSRRMCVALRSFLISSLALLGPLSVGQALASTFEVRLSKDYHSEKAPETFSIQLTRDASPELVATAADATYSVLRTLHRRYRNPISVQSQSSSFELSTLPLWGFEMSFSEGGEYGFAVRGPNARDAQSAIEAAFAIARSMGIMGEGPPALEVIGGMYWSIPLHTYAIPGNPKGETTTFSVEHEATGRLFLEVAAQIFERELQPAPSNACVEKTLRAASPRPRPSTL